MTDPVDEVVAFIRSPQIGCPFARHIAQDPDAEGLRSLVVDAPVAGWDLAVLLDELAQDAPQIATAIFPHVKSTDALVSLILEIDALPGWHYEIVDVEDGSAVGVGLRWAMPDHIHESWVLGFAPFDHMPATRRAPHVCLMWKVDPFERPFLGRKPSTTSGRRPIHLADLRYEGSVESFSKTWVGAKNLRRTSLAGSLEGAAKAKVTFAVPRHHWPLSAEST